MIGKRYRIISRLARQVLHRPSETGPPHEAQANSEKPMCASWWVVPVRLRSGPIDRYGSKMEPPPVDCSTWFNFR